MIKDELKTPFNPKQILDKTKPDTQNSISNSKQVESFVLNEDTKVTMKDGSTATIKQLMTDLGSEGKVDCHCLHPDHEDNNPSAFIAKKTDRLFHHCMSCGSKAWFPQKEIATGECKQVKSEVVVKVANHTKTLESLNHGYNMTMRRLLDAAIATMPTLDYDNVEHVKTSDIIENINRNLLFQIKKINSCLYLYAGGKWHKFKDGNVATWFVRELVIKSYGKQIPRLCSIVEATLKELNIDILPPLEEEDNKTFINCANHVLEIDQGETQILPHDPKYAFSYILEHDYDPDINTTDAFNFCMESIEEKEAVLVLFEFLGSCFISPKVLNMEKIIIFHGDGGSGKSTLQQLIKMTLGKSNISNVELHEFTDDNKIQTTIGRILNLGTEVNHRSIDPSTIKRVASSEPMTVNVKYQNSIVIEEFPKIICSTNNLPTCSDDTSNGYFRRFMIFSFDKIFNYEEKDPKFNARLNALKSAMLTLTIEGAQRLLKNGKFTYSPKIDAANKKFRNEVDSVRSFISHCELRLPTAQDTVKFTTGANLQEEYQHFCLSQGLRAVTKNHLLRALVSHGFSAYKSGNNRGYSVIIGRPSVDNIDSEKNNLQVGKDGFTGEEQSNPWVH